MNAWQILEGDALERLRELDTGSVQTCVTSPPYFGLRDYGDNGQLGLEATPDEYVARLVEVFREVRRVLRDDGTLWLNLGDSYAGGKQGRADHGSGDPTSRLGPDRDGIPGGTPMGEIAQRPVPPGYKPKDLLGIPWMVAFALRADGWYLRCDIIWAKKNCMPESVTDRPTKAHEYVFLLSKSPRYFWDADAVREDATEDREPSRKAKASGAGHLALRPNGTPYDGTNQPSYKGEAPNCTESTGGHAPSPRRCAHGRGEGAERREGCRRSRTRCRTGLPSPHTEPRAPSCAPGDGTLGACERR